MKRYLVAVEMKDAYRYAATEAEAMGHVTELRDQYPQFCVAVYDRIMVDMPRSKKRE